MRLEGELNGSKVEVLVDSGASLSFINPSVIHRLKLRAENIKPLGVRVANGERLECKSKLEDIPLRLQCYEFTTTLFALPVMGIDIILGIPWLEGLGPVLSDYSTMTMQFTTKEGREVMLQGRTVKEIDIVDAKVALTDWKNGGELFVLSGNITPQSMRVENEEVQQLLEEFKDVMEEPKSLPPLRRFDHRIRLTDEKAVVNVAPYRYAHYQKNEIEKQVNELLKSGLIRPSTSPFSSPILLVRKKDGTWRFCTDYRRLNEATVKDRFPIPTVDDMLDQLHGAEYSAN